MPCIKHQVLCEPLKCKCSAPSFSAPSSLLLVKEAVTGKQTLQEFSRPSGLAEDTPTDLPGATGTAQVGVEQCPEAPGMAGR